MSTQSHQNPGNPILRIIDAATTYDNGMSCAPHEALSADERNALMKMRAARDQYQAQKRQLAKAKINAPSEADRLEQEMEAAREHSRKARQLWQQANREKMIRLGHIE